MRTIRGQQWICQTCIAREQYYLRSQPDWFSDDEHADAPEASTIEGRVKKISRDIDSLKKKVDVLSEQKVESLLDALTARLQVIRATVRRQQVLLVILLAIVIYLAVAKS